MFSFMTSTLNENFIYSYKVFFANCSAAKIVLIFENIWVIKKKKKKKKKLQKINRVFWRIKCMLRWSCLSQIFNRSGVYTSDRL